MNFDKVNLLVSSLGGVKFFPSDPAAQLGIVQLMGQLTDDETQVQWLVDQIKLLPEWPGLFGVRQIFLSRFRPKDGLVQALCSCGCGNVQTWKLTGEQQWPPQIAGAPEPIALLTEGERKFKENIEKAK